MLFNTLTPSRKEELHAEQIEIELKSLDLGVERYRKWRQDADRSRGTPEMRLIGQALDAVIPAIRLARNSVLSKTGAGRGVAHWGYPLWCMDPDKMAVITMVTMLNLADTYDATFATVCRNLGTAIEQEYQFEKLKKDHRKLYEVVSRKIKNWTPRQVGYMRKKVDAVERRWPLRTRYWVGYKLIECVLGSTEMFQYQRYVETRWGKPKRIAKLGVSPDVRTELDKQHSGCEIMRPYYLPMVVPPGNWTTISDGGFRYHRYPLVKSQNLSDNPIDHAVPGPQVLDAVNAIQRTGWQVNQTIHRIMLEVWKAGGGYAGLPSAEPRPIPAKPDDINENEEARSKYKQEAREAHDYNAKTISKRKSILNKLRIAGAYYLQKEFFFPWQLDYRGRMYPVAGDLHPQADDPARGLLRFSEGKALGSDGWRWLCIRLANCMDQDKLSFDHRVRWVEDRMLDWNLVSQDPIETKALWILYDEQGKLKNDPWQALATILEIVDAGFSKNPEEFVSHLPINLDGTCNGLQHFAAMLLDPVAAKAVNLSPGTEPNDIYSKVAAKVIEAVTADCQEIPIDREVQRGINKEGEVMYWITPHPCWQWKGRITRKTTKRSTMTLPYGVTLEGMTSQFITDGHTEGMEQPRQCALYMRDKTWTAIEQTVESAQLIMSWLKKCASITAKKGHALHWVSPAGFPVTQEALEYKQTAIYTLLQRVHIPLTEDGKISVHRQQRCMPPNFVHALDAAHAQLTVCHALQDGITSFNMIHDSFGVHACHVSAMATAIRVQFVRMYAFSDILADYKEQWEMQTSCELPDPPERGSFDLRQVTQSLYFFG